MTGKGLRVREYLGRQTLRDDLAAMLAGAKPHIDHVIGGVDRLLIVLDDEDAVAEIAQMTQRLQQATVVALMQSDRRLVEHIHHAGESGADLRGETNALRFAPGETVGVAVE